MGPKSPTDNQPVPRRSPRTNPAASWSPSTPGPVLAHPSALPSACKTEASPKTPRNLIQPSASGQTLSPQHAKLRPLAGRSVPSGSSKSPTGKGSPAQAAKPVLKLSMQSSPEHPNQPRRKTSMTSESVQHPVHRNFTPVSSKGVNDLLSHDAKLNSDANISQMPCSSKIQIQIAAAPVQLTLNTCPQDSFPAATPHTAGAPVSKPTITTSSAAQATYALNQTKIASAPSPGYQDSASAVSSLNDGVLAPGPTLDSQKVPAVSTHTAGVPLAPPPREAVCAAQAEEEVTNATTAAAASQAMPAATSASAADAGGAVAQQVLDSLQNPDAKLSSDVCTAAQQGQRSSGAPTSAEAAAGPRPALQHADYKVTSALTTQYISAGAPPATVTSPRAAVSAVEALSSELALASHTADAPASMQIDSQTDITGHAQSLPTNPLCSFRPQAVASTASLLDQPLTAPAHEPAANSPTDDEQAKQAELPKEGALYMELSEPATASTALCNALALSLPAPIRAVPTAAAAVSAAGLAGLTPHTSASPPATKFADPLAVPIKLEAVCMPFNLMGPSMLPAVSPRAPAASVSPHSRAGTPHSFFRGLVLPDEGSSEGLFSKSPSHCYTIPPDLSSFTLPSDFSLGSISPPNPPEHPDSSPQPPSHASLHQHTPETADTNVPAQLQHFPQQQLVKASSPDTCPLRDPRLTPPPNPRHKSPPVYQPPHHPHMQSDPLSERSHDPHTLPHSFAPQPTHQHAQAVYNMQHNHADKQTAILTEIAIRALRAEPSPALSLGPRDSCKPAAMHGPRIKTTIRTATCDDAHIPTVKVVASGRVLPSAKSPKAKSSRPTAKSKGPQSNPAGKSSSPEASVSGTTVTLVSSSPTPSAVDSSVARGQQAATAELDCSERLGTDSLPDPSLMSQPSPDFNRDCNVQLLHCVASMETPQESPRKAVSASEVLSQAAAAEHHSGACNAAVLAVAAGESPAAPAAAIDGSAGIHLMEEWGPDEEAMQAACALAELAESAWTGNSISEVDDAKQLHKEAPQGQAVTLTEVRDHLRSFVTQLDDAPSEPTMLPWLSVHEQSPDGQGCSPSSHTTQTPGSASAAFVTDDIPAAAYNPHANSYRRRTPLQQECQPCIHQRQPPDPPQTLASPPASLAVPSSGWPILTPTSGQTDPTRPQTELTKLQTREHPAGSATWSLAPRWSDAHTRAAATAPRHICFEGSVPISTPFTSVLPLSARAEGVFSCSAVRSPDAVSAEQQPSGSTSKRKRASERSGTGRSPTAGTRQHRCPSAS